MSGRGGIYQGPNGELHGDGSAVVKVVDLTPDYPAVYAHFTRDLDAVAALLVRYPDLAHLHAWLAPFAIAFQAATGEAQVIQLREHVTCLLSKVADRVAEIAEDT